MQIRFSELRGKVAYNGGGEPLGQIINAVVAPQSEEAFVVTMRASGKHVGSSVVPISKFKLIDGKEIIFAVSGIPGGEMPKDYDSFLSDRQNPGAMNSSVYSLNRKKVLGTIYDYLFDTESGKRLGVLIEEVTMGRKRKFLAPAEKAFRAEDKALGTKKILINSEELQQIA
jgi:uncharacterized protein YrrD